MINTGPVSGLTRLASIELLSQIIEHVVGPHMKIISEYFHIGTEINICFILQRYFIFEGFII